MMKSSWLIARGLVVGYMAYLLVAVLMGKEWLFIDGVNLLFHEAGHILLGVLGPISGTVMQLVIPVGCMSYFLVRREWFSGLMCGFWVGENLVNIGRYIGDALVQELPLVGGGVHDWGLLLGDWGLLRQAEAIGAGVWWLGMVVMSLAWIGLMVVLGFGVRGYWLVKSK